MLSYNSVFIHEASCEKYVPFENITWKNWKHRKILIASLQKTVAKIRDNVGLTQTMRSNAKNENHCKAQKSF